MTSSSSAKRSRPAKSSSHAANLASKAGSRILGWYLKRTCASIRKGKRGQLGEETKGPCFKTYHNSFGTYNRSVKYAPSTILRERRCMRDRCIDTGDTLAGG